LNNNKLFPNFVRDWSRKNPTFYIWTIQKNLFRIITSPIRTIPNLITIGTSRGGTESLYHYIRHHPNIAVSSKREIYFFGKDPHYDTGLNWYRSFFPTTIFEKFFNKTHKKNLIIYEGSTDYLFQSKAPKRIFDDLGNIKFIVMLRNPVERAYSHFYHNIDTGLDNLDSFEEAIKLEPKRLKEWSNDGLDDTMFNHYAYLKRGIYVDQLENWFKIFPREKFLIMKTEDLKKDPQKIVNQLYDFVGLPHAKIREQLNRNIAHYPKPINPETRKKLVDYFKPHNERLNKLLNTNFNWV